MNIYISNNTHIHIYSIIKSKYKLGWTFTELFPIFSHLNNPVTSVFQLSIPEYSAYLDNLLDFLKTIMFHYVLQHWDLTSCGMAIGRTGASSLCLSQHCKETHIHSKLRRHPLLPQPAPAVLHAWKMERDWQPRRKGGAEREGLKS